MTAHPPKPRLALAVGVVGHRPNRLPEAARTTVAAQVEEALAGMEQAAREARERHRGVFAEEPPVLRLLSALAEGADRMSAVAALEAGWPLAAVLPFPADDYERDFAEDSSKEEFADLLKRAERTLVLPGSRDREAAGYEAAGETILDNADILLAVWDGGASAGRGGTSELVERAARADMPIVHVDAKGEEAPRVLWSGLAEFPAPGADASGLPTSDLQSALPRIVDTLLRPPRDQVEKDKLSRYLEQPWRPRNWRLEVPLLLAALRLRALRRTDFRPKEPAVLAADIEDQLRLEAPQQPGMLPLDERSRTALAFGWADALGLRYGQIFRGAYSSNFLAAALAVVAGTASLIGTRLFDWPGAPLAVTEVALMVFIGINTWFGRRRDWHNRWRESREVAERLRAAVPLWQVARRATSSSAAPAWTAWYVRAHLRALGPVDGVFDKARLEDIRQRLITVVEDQRAYHTSVAGLMRSVEFRIERVGLVLFGLAFLFGGISVATAVFGPDLTPKWDLVLTGLAAALPALGAATFGIRLIGDFEGIAQRSEQTGAMLAGLGAALRQDAPSLVVLRSRATALADAMLGDMAHWRMTTESRKLVAPG